MEEDAGSAAAALEDERRRLEQDGHPVPPTPVAHARRVLTGRSTDPVWWLTGDGWAAVVKVMAPPSGALDWDEGWRELLAHRSGLLGSLPPGIRAPRCLGVAARPGGIRALWLEGLQGPTAPHWPLAWYGTVGEHLGRTQGAYVASVPVPDHSWLNRGSLRQYAEAHPCGDAGPAGAAEGLQLRCDEHVVDALEQLPPTVCHFDLHPRNLIVGGGEVVAVDWSSIGIGCVGEDVSTLVASAVLDGHVAGGRLEELCGRVVRGYAAGLSAAGLDVDGDGLARAVGALLVVRLGWVVDRRLRDPKVSPAERGAARAVGTVLSSLAEAVASRPPADVVGLSPRSRP